MNVSRTTYFSPDAFLLLSGAMGNERSYFVNSIATGECELWSINHGESYAITRIDLEANKTTLVICCYGGDSYTKNLLAFGNYVIDLCKARKWSIRIHTNKAKISDFMQKHFDFDQPEYVLTRGFKDGRKIEQ